MIRQKIVLPKYDNWTIYAYYAVSTYFVEEIMEQLWEANIDAQNAKDAWDNLSSGEVDTGLCYSNYAKRITVLVVAKTSSAAEFFNSLTHESAHCCIHIATTFGINYRSEEFAYMVGELCREMYPRVKNLLCECCRNKE
jgi:hypothetical protein